MHSSLHFAIGIIIAGLTKPFYPAGFWPFAFIVGCSFGPDFDIIFSKYAKDFNHRNLFTHSVYIPLGLIIVGFSMQNPWILIGGISYFCHLLPDLLDWGTNLWSTGKTVGYQILLEVEERGKVLDIIKDLPEPHWFFIERYYNSTIIKIIEMGSFIVMVSCFIWLVPSNWYFIFGYMATLGFHGIEYSEYKHRANGGTPRIQLIRH